jgi:hypothetical protein
VITRANIDAAGHDTPSSAFLRRLFRVWRAPASAALLISLFAAPAHARECAGVTMPDNVRIDGKELLLNGLGLREATILNVDVYVAGLYLEQRQTDGNQIIHADVVKHARLAFVRNVSRAELYDELGSQFKRAAEGRYEQHKAMFNTLISWLPALKVGDVFIVTYRPGQGLEVRLGDRLLGTLQDAEFARVMFSIWLGDHPPNKGLKAGLLGGRCG